MACSCRGAEMCGECRSALFSPAKPKPSPAPTFGEHRCDECGQSFSLVTMLWQHEKEHAENRRRFGGDS